MPFVASVLVVLITVWLIWILAPKLLAFIHNYSTEQEKKYQSELKNIKKRKKQKAKKL